MGTSSQRPIEFILKTFEPKPKEGSRRLGSGRMVVLYHTTRYLCSALVTVCRELVQHERTGSMPKTRKKFRVLKVSFCVWKYIFFLDSVLILSSRIYTNLPCWIAKWTRSSWSNKRYGTNSWNMNTISYQLRALIASDCFWMSGIRTLHYWFIHTLKWHGSKMAFGPGDLNGWYHCTWCLWWCRNEENKVKD